jgi:co-chaperonin GroES (HSP10)
MHIEPLSDVVILRRQKVDKIGSIAIPISSPDFQEDIGTVFAAGPDTSLKSGDMVLFSTHGHQITTIEGEEYIVTRHNSVIAKINGSR